MLVQGAQEMTGNNTIPNMFELEIVIIVKLVLVYSIITSIIKFMFITSSKLTKKNKKLTTTKNHRK
jgi:hypothetical protein